MILIKLFVLSKFLGSANKVLQSFIQAVSRNLSLNIEQRTTGFIVD